MRFLLDTNIFLELILEQERANEARRFIDRSNELELYISDFSLHSIGILLLARKQHSAFQQFVSDVVTNAGVGVASLAESDMNDLIAAAQRYQLDFDDAYQYVLSQKLRLELVSFDSDFDRTPQGKKAPSEVTPSEK